MSEPDVPASGADDKPTKNDKPKDANVAVAPIHLAGYHDVAQAILLMILLAVTSNASKSVLRPLYGPLLAASWFRFGSFFSIVAFSYLLPSGIRGIRSDFGILAFVLFQGPFTATIAARWAAENIQNPSISPVLAHLVLGYPALGMGSAIWLRIMNQFLEPEVTRLGQLAVTGFTWLAVENCIHYLDHALSETVPFLSRIPPHMMFTALGVFSMALPFFALNPTTDCQRSRMSNIQLLCIVGITLSCTWSTPIPSTGLKLLSQTYSTAGLIQVVDYHLADKPFRYLRRDAAILGGTWLTPSLEDPNDLAPASGSVINAFALRDAVRVVVGPGTKRALVIGAREGSVTRSLMSHGYNTTLVEPEPVIYSAAKEFFALPEPNEVYIGEVGNWVWQEAKTSRASNATTDSKYDVVVHDAFAGDKPDPTLFTTEFLGNLRLLMNADAVLAVNFVGFIGSITFKQALYTLLSNYETCRVFHAGTTGPSPLRPNEMAELVIICRPAGSVTFHIEPSDFENVSSRYKDILLSLDKREVKPKDLPEDSVPREKLVLKMKDRWLQSWGKNLLKDHWRAARQVLQPKAWNMY